MNRLRASVEEVTHKSVCETCHQPISQSVTTAQLATLVKNIEDLQLEMTAKTDWIAGIIHRGQAKKAQLVDEQEARSKLSESSKRVKAIDAELSKIAADSLNVTKVKAELDGLNAIQPVDEALLVAKQKKLDDATNELTALLAKQNAFTQWEVDNARRKELEKQGLALLARSDIYKKAIEIVTEEREKVVGQAFNSIIAPARRITDGVLPGELGYRNGSIGILTDGRWMTYRTFSGNFKTIAFAALSTALARQSAVRVVVIDEMGTIARDRKIALVNRMTKLVREGFIDNVIGCDLRSDDYADILFENFKLVELKG
jgi:hypothetical protein